MSAISFDHEYLVVSRKAADSLRAVLDQPKASEPSLRNVLIASLREGRLLHTLSGRTGRVRRFQFHFHGVECVAEVWSPKLDGKPALSTRGDKLAAILTRIDAVPAAAS